ncbi:MAG: hypothetical protein OZ929_04600, partial [Bryobacterales bacterium]|nr:hypothetical protein [Bryobacterales bacterium]
MTINVSRVVFLVVLTVSSRSLLPAQHVSFGFVGGTPLTRDFPITRTFYTASETSTDLIAFDWFSDTRSFLAGLS